jgi:carbon storage regulator
MLRITRRSGERIRVGDNVIIDVIEVRGGTVRLGIDAPRSIPVFREELWLEVSAENQAAAQAPERLPSVPAQFRPAGG